MRGGTAGDALVQGGEQVVQVGGLFDRVARHAVNLLVMPFFQPFIPLGRFLRQ